MTESERKYIHNEVIKFSRALDASSLMAIFPKEEKSSFDFQEELDLLLEAIMGNELLIFWYPTRKSILKRFRFLRTLHPWLKSHLRFAQYKRWSGYLRRVFMIERLYRALETDREALHEKGNPGGTIRSLLIECARRLEDIEKRVIGRKEFLFNLDPPTVDLGDGTEVNAGDAREEVLYLTSKAITVLLRKTERKQAILRPSSSETVNYNREKISRLLHLSGLMQLALDCQSDLLLWGSDLEIRRLEEKIILNMTPTKIAMALKNAERFAAEQRARVF